MKLDLKNATIQEQNKNGRLLVITLLVFICSFFMFKHIYTDNHKEFKKITSMNEQRRDHQATLLPDGRVLITGGWNFKRLKTAEIYDPNKNKFIKLSDMIYPHNGHLAFATSGNVIILDTYSGENEVFNSKTNKFYTMPKMVIPRTNYCASLLKDGRILIAGGKSFQGTNLVSQAEIYTPSINKFTLASNIKHPRYDATLITLNNGNVVLIGGNNNFYKKIKEQNREWKVPEKEKDVELYNPITRLFEEAGKIDSGYISNITKLKDDNLLLTYNHSNPEKTSDIYDTKRNIIKNLNKSKNNFADYETYNTLLLKDGKVLFVGLKSHYNNAEVSNAQLFTPQDNNFHLISKTCYKRGYESLTLLNNGSVLITGGTGEAHDSDFSSTNNVEIYTDKRK